MLNKALRFIKHREQVSGIMRSLLFIALGGALGALARHGCNQLGARSFGVDFPVGTLVANLLGCLLIGILAGILPRTALGTELSPLLVTGFLGALTTFSTFGLQTVLMAQEGSISTALLNVALHLGGGLLAVGTGLALVR